MRLLLKGSVRRQFKVTLQGGAWKSQKMLTFSLNKKQNHQRKKVKAIMEKI